MSRMLRWALVVLALLLVAGGLTWSRFRAGREVPAYSVETVARRPLRDSVAGNGELRARTTVNVGVQVTAAIKVIHVHDGQWVKAGQILVTLEQERYRQALNQAEMGLRMARKDLEIAQATFTREDQSYRRQAALHQHRILSSEAFQKAELVRDNAATTLDRARVAVQQARAQAAIARDDLDKTVIRASMAGQVTRLKAERGETAVAGATNLSGAVLMVISDLSELLAEFQVGELDVVKLKAGQPAEATVDALPSRTFRGQVLSVATATERPEGGMTLPGVPEAQGYKVRILLDRDQDARAELRPGMSARTAVLTAERDAALTVPLAAIQERPARDSGLGLLPASRSVVFVVRDGVAREREIRTGLTTRREAEVVSGLQEGELVITGPTKQLTLVADGLKVVVRKEVR